MFRTPGVFRYSLQWPINVPSFGDQVYRSIDTLIGDESAYVVAGWSHDPSGVFRMRHRHIVALLRGRGWRITTSPGLGLGLLAIRSGELSQVMAALDREHFVRWFVLRGDIGLEELSEAPFRATLENWVATRDLAPSAPFLRSLAVRHAAVLYVLRGDSTLPTLCVVSGYSMRASVLGAFPEALVEIREMPGESGGEPPDGVREI
jgi:hypothetical protein